MIRRGWETEEHIPSQSKVFQSLCINNNQAADTQKMIYELSIPQTQQHLTQHMLLHSSLLLPGYGSLFLSTTHLVASCALSLNKFGQYPSGGCGRRVVKLVCRGGGGGYIVCEGDLVGVEKKMGRGSKTGVIALFDVDGTLTPARKDISPEMLKFLQELRKAVTVGVVGGSDLIKISEQLGKSAVNDYDYLFSENGLVAYQDGKLIGNQSLKVHLGEEKLKEIINFVLHYIADLEIPIKRGTFIEFRMGMLNVSPIGRNCNQEEREEFERYDKVHNVRKTMIDVLKEKFRDFSLSFAIGGQISFDVFPRGWDKTFCLQFVEKEFSEIHFFGDKTYQGGNDYEIFDSPKTIGHTVTSPEDTMKQCTEIFLSKALAK